MIGGWMAWDNLLGAEGASEDDRLPVGNSLILVGACVSIVSATTWPQCPQKWVSAGISSPQNVQRCMLTLLYGNTIYKRTMLHIITLPYGNTGRRLPGYVDVTRSTREREGGCLTARNLSIRLSDCYLYRLARLQHAAGRVESEIHRIARSGSAGSIHRPA